MEICLTFYLIKKHNEKKNMSELLKYYKSRWKEFFIA